MSAPILRELLAAIEARFDGREPPAVASIHRPPGGSGEQTSPFTLVVLDASPVAAGLCYNLLEERAARERAYGDVGRGLGKDVRMVGERPADEIGRELQADDLLAAVGHQLRQLHDARQNVGVVRRLAVGAEQLGAGLELADLGRLALSGAGQSFPEF